MLSVSQLYCAPFKSEKQSDQRWSVFGNEVQPQFPGGWFDEPAEDVGPSAVYFLDKLQEGILPYG